MASICQYNTSAEDFCADHNTTVYIQHSRERWVHCVEVNSWIPWNACMALHVGLVALVQQLITNQDLEKGEDIILSHDESGDMHWVHME